MAGEPSAREAPSGELDVGPVRWAWRARPVPGEELDGEPSPFLEWWEVRFRRDDDEEQEARVRAGVPDGEGWSDELLRSILDSARERTWRDAGGDLWRVRLEGWSATGISTEVAEAGGDAERRVVFERPGDGERVRRAGPDLRSLTVEADERLQRLLEAGDPGA